MNYNQNGHCKHRKYRLIESFETSSDVVDIITNITHRCFKINNHQIGDEFYLFERSRGDYDEEKIIFKYSILNLYKVGQTVTFDIIDERDNLLFVSNHIYLRFVAPCSFKETEDQTKIDLEIEELNLEFNKLMFKEMPFSKIQASENLDVFEENVDYKFEIIKTFHNKHNNLNMIVSYQDENYFINVPSHLSQVKFKSPLFANIASSGDGVQKYLRLSRKYISNTLYKVGQQYTFKIIKQVQSYESGISYWTVEDSYGNRNRYSPEEDLTFDNKLAQLGEGDNINLIIHSIGENGYIKLISEIKDWAENGYLVEDVFEAIGYKDKEDEYFFKYVNVLGVEYEEPEDFENSYLEQYNDGNNLWVFSYLSFLDVEIYNDLNEGNFETARKLIEIYLNFEKWILEESDYLTNFSLYKIENIIQKAESKIVKLKATLTAIDIFLDGNDQKYIDDLHKSLLRTPYLKKEKREIFKQFLNISQYFRGEADFEELANTIFLLLERNLISSEERWAYINSFVSFINRIKERINELLSDDIQHEKTKEFKLLITYNYLLIYFYIIDGNKFKATVTSINLLQNLSLYYYKVEYLDLAIDLIINNGYIEPNVFKHKNIFDLDHKELRKICVYNKSKDHTFQSAGNILNLNGDFTIIPKNLYSGVKNYNLKTLAKLGDFNLYVKSHFDLNTIDENLELDLILENTIQTIKHHSKTSEYGPNNISYKELNISEDKIHSGIVKKMHSNGAYCYLTCIVDDLEIDTLLHINNFHGNRLAGKLNDFIKIGDKINFEIIKVEEGRISISPAIFIDKHAEQVLDDNKYHYGKVIQRHKRYSKVLTTDGLPVIVNNYSYHVGEVVQLKINEYRDSIHIYASDDHELCSEVITENAADLFRKHLISIGMITPIEAQGDLENTIKSKTRKTGHIRIEENSKDLRVLTAILIYCLEHRLNYITDPKETAFNYFFIITLSGVIKHPKSFEYSNKLNNLAKIISLEYKKDIELLDTILIDELTSDIDNLEKLKEENTIIGMLQYMDSDVIDLPVNISPSSPQYKLKKLIESVNLLKSYELGGKLTEALKKLVVHELYNTTLQVNNNSIKELKSILSNEYDVEKTEKPKRVVTNLGAESKYKEFKSSLFYSASEEPQKDVILRTICGFLNSYEGKGALYIGVNDAGEIKGLKEDLRYKEHINNLDKYLNHFQSLIVEAFPKEINALLDYKFYKSNNLNYLEVTIPSHNKPIAYKDEFYQRQGVQTRILKGEDITDFIIRKTSNSTVAAAITFAPQTTATQPPEAEKDKDNKVNTAAIDTNEVMEYAVGSKLDVYSMQDIDFAKDIKQLSDSQPTKYDMVSDNLLAYLYILKDDQYFRYMLSATKIKDYEIEVKITEKYKFGHLLFCYSNACINKVDIRSIINKSFNTIYMSTFSNVGDLMRIIKSLPNDEIGIETKRLNKNYVKLYDIDYITENKVIGLKGNCIVEENFDKVVAYYHNDTMPEGLEIFRTDSKKGYGREVAIDASEYELLKELSN